MNKVFKVIWNEARNAYVVVSEIAKNRGSKSCSTKKLLAMLIATGVMTCASFDVLAARPTAAQTAQSQYVAFGDQSAKLIDGQERNIDGHKYIYDADQKYWVREGYILKVEENGDLHTPLSANSKASDVAYIGNGDTDSILQSVTSMVSASGTVTNMGESLNKINASAFAGVSHGGGTAVDGKWDYIIQDSSWKDKDSVASGNYKDGYVDLIDQVKGIPKGFVTADASNTALKWDDTKQTYTYNGKQVDYSNVYVIDGKIGVFTNKDGSDFYKGTVFGKNNEILMTVKDADNHFYSYWASEVTDPSATMQSYRLVEYKKDLAALVENDKMLNRNDIKEVTMTTDANSAIIGLLRNGDTEAGAPVTGAITVTSGGGTGGSDTFVKISNGTVNQTFATGSKVEAIGTPEATAGIKINGQEYTIKSGSVVSVAKDASNKTTTITVDGKATTITDTDTTYTAGDGIEINGGNAISVSKNLTGMQSIKGAGAGSISFDGANVKVNNTTFSKNSVVVGVAGDGKHPVRINGESGEILGLGNDTITYTTFAQTDGKAATEKQLKQVMDEGWNFTTDSGAKTTVTVGEAGNEVKFNGDSANIEVTNNGKDIKVALKNDLTVDSVKAGDFFMDKNQGVGYADKAYITSSGLNANNQKITGVADGTNDTDAVNFGQLKETNTKVENLKVEAGKHTTLVAGENVQLNQENTDKGLQYTINAKDTTYAAGNGITISGANNEISVKVKAGENNLQVTDAGLELKKDLTVDSVKAGSSFMSATGIGYGDKAYITSSGLNANNQKITGVAAGNADTDAVNVGQLKTVSEVANQGWKLSTNGDAASKVAPGEIVDFSGDKNISVSHNGTKVKVELNDELEDIKSISNGDSRINLNADSISISNGNKSFAITNSGIGMSYITADYSAKSIMLGENGTTISGGLNVAGSKITGVAAGTIAAGSTDAVNGSQLNDIKNSINTDISNKTFGLKDDKGSEVTSTLGNTVQVKGADGITSTVKDGALEIGLKLQEGSNLVVNSNGLALNTALTGIQSINGTGAGSISFADGGNVKVNDVTIEKGGKITGVAAGTTEKDAVNFGQLDATNKKVDNLTTEVGKGWVVATENGTATKVGAGDTVKFSGADNNIKVSNDGTNVKVELNKDLTVDSVKAGDFFMDKNEGVGYKGKAYITSSGLNANGQTITNVKAGEAEIDAVNVGQLNAVKAEASKKTTLSNGKNTTVTSVTTDGQTDYKVNVAGDLKDITSVANGASEIKLNADSIIIANTNKTFAITNSGIGMSYVASDYSTKAIMLGENGTTISGGLNVAGSKITGVAAGTAATDAVNVGQLNAVKETANKGWKLKTNNGNVSDVKPGDEVEFDGDDNIKVSNAGNKVSFKLNNKLTGIESIAGVGGGSISFSGGNVTINNNVTFGSNGQIHNVTAGTASTDAVNVGQLNAAVQAGNTDTHIKPGEYGVGADNKVNMDVVDKTGTKINTVTITDVAKASDLGNVNNINNDLKNSNGTTTVVDAVNNLNQKLDNKVGDLQYSKVDKGDIADGDSTTTAIGKLDQKLNDVAATAAKQHTTVSGSGNIVVEDPTINADGGKNYNVKLADDINVNSVTANTFKADQTVMNKDGLKVGEKVSVTENAVTAGKTSISDDGVKVGDKTYISADGLNANDQKVTNVSDGKVEKDSKDAINGGQLHQAKADINNRIDGVENQVISNTNCINKLGSRVNKVGAGAAALAALHPMDFDPDDKLTFSAGYGNYAGENAAAIGAYYRPDEKVMFSVAGTVGNGENMVNAGVSFALDRTNHVSNSRTALAREVIDLRGQLAVMGAKMAKMEKAFGMLDETKTKLFPDVPANHWAYEYIAKLAGNGYIEGYPDGNFGGDRLMTRYEFAAMLYRAIENGAALEEKIIKEFEPELGRIRVDRISGEDGDRDKIERVRVNDTKGERDHYGNKLVK